MAAQQRDTSDEPALTGQSLGAVDAGGSAIVLLSAFGGMMPSLQPLLLGELSTVGRIDVAAVGQIATVEALSMAVAVTLAGVMLPTDRLRPVAAGALVAGIVSNLATGFVPVPVIIALRMLAGAGSGLLLWLFLSLLARSALPARITGWYVVVQGTAALGLSALISNWLAARFGATGGYFALAALGGALLPFVLRMPVGYARLADAPKFVLPTWRGAVGLSIAGLQLAGIMAFWVYILPVGQALGYPSDMVHFAISCAIAVQIAAGLAATRFAALPAQMVVAACLLLGIAALLVLVLVREPVAFTTGAAVFSFAWVFVLGYHVPFVVGFDLTKKSVMVLTGVQLLGVAAGPSFAAAFLSMYGDVGPAVAAIILLALASLILLAARQGVLGAGLHPFRRRGPV